MHYLLVLYIILIRKKMKQHELLLFSSFIVNKLLSLNLVNQKFRICSVKLKYSLSKTYIKENIAVILFCSYLCRN